MVCSTAATVEACWRMSVWMKSPSPGPRASSSATCWPRSVLYSATTTWAPAAASRRATPSPTPCPAPVTRPTRPFSGVMSSPSLVGCTPALEVGQRVLALGPGRLKMARHPLRGHCLQAVGLNPGLAVLVDQQRPHPPGKIGVAQTLPGQHQLQLEGLLQRQVAAPAKLLLHQPQGGGTGRGQRPGRLLQPGRSEERRVGEECRSEWGPDSWKKNIVKMWKKW